MGIYKMVLKCWTNRPFLIMDKKSCLQMQISPISLNTTELCKQLLQNTHQAKSAGDKDLTDKIT